MKTPGTAKCRALSFQKRGREGPRYKDQARERLRIRNASFVCSATCHHR